jgi:hypothetical protein
MRLTDVRCHQLQSIGDTELLIKQSKTVRGQSWEITPAIREILEAASK